MLAYSISIDGSDLLIQAGSTRPGASSFNLGILNNHQARIKEYAWMILAGLGNPTSKKKAANLKQLDMQRIVSTLRIPEAMDEGTQLYKHTIIAKAVLTGESQVELSHLQFIDDDVWVSAVNNGVDNLNGLLVLLSIRYATPQEKIDSGNEVLYSVCATSAYVDKKPLFQF